MAAFAREIIRDRLESGSSSGRDHSVCRHRLKLKVQVAGIDKLVIVHPENVMCEEVSE
jgi:hypothetical protein